MTEERMERLFLAVDEAQLEPDPEFVARLRETVLDEATAEAGSPVDTIDRYAEESVSADETDSSAEKPWRGSRWPLGIAAAVLLLAALAAVALFAARDDDSTVATAPPDPQDVVDAYFAAYNGGDVEALLALLAPDATFASQFRGATAEPQLQDRGQWEQRLVWNAAQGTEQTPPSCTLVDDQPAEGATISCDYERLDAPTQAVGALPVATTSRFTVGAIGISEIVDYHGYGTPRAAFLHVGEPFRRWLQSNHPDETCLAVSALNRGQCDEWAEIGWTSLARAREDGVLVAQYAREWAAYLEANDCDYLDRC